MVHTNKQHKFKTSVNAQNVRVTSYKDVNFEGLRKSNCNLVLGFSSAGVIFNRKTRDSKAMIRDITHKRPSEVMIARTPASFDNSMNLDTLAGTRALALRTFLVIEVEVPGGWVLVEAFKLVKLDLLCMVLFKCGLKRLWSRSWLAEVLLNLFPAPPVAISGGGEEDDWFDLKNPLDIGLV